MFPPSRVQDADAPIRSTDNDAAVARLSAARKGYLNDPYVQYLVPRANFLPPRPPLINVGTYVRTAGIDNLVDQFMDLSKQAKKKCQIVSLGAGSDTRFWRIAAGSRSARLQTYIELDFPEITTKKAMAIRKHKELSLGLGDPTQVFVVQGGAALHSSRYHLLPIDLRVNTSETLEAMLATPKEDQPAILDPSLPTLILFECVLAYMSPQASSDLLRWFTSFIRRVDTGDSRGASILGCIIYEMFGLNDSFGRVMLNNLKERQISIPGVEPYNDEESLPNRFTETGFTAARALTLKEIRKSYVEPSELERISKLEFLDELEELDLVLAHYAISWGLYLSEPSESLNWGKWGLVHNSES